MAEDYPDTYTVFAGGDDLFLIGAWNEMLKLARTITDRFRAFTKGALSLSIGIILVKPNTPVSYVALKSEEALEASKEMPAKAAITLFGQTAKLEEYCQKGRVFYGALKQADTSVFELPMAFLYRLLALLEMRMSIRPESIEGSMWKSKLNYTFRRNVFDKIKEKSKTEQAERLLEQCDKMIEDHPEVARMVLSEFIYNRRKAS
jgi:CRISPR-associated protein Csm1